MDMYYYEVLVASQKYHKPDGLTYQYDGLLEPGALVAVELQKTLVVGIVVAPAAKPTFIAKPITRVIVETVLPIATLQLLRWMSHYYPSSMGTLTAQFVPGNLLQTARNATVQPDAGNDTQTVLPPLTKEQKSALAIIQTAKPGSTVILHGDTGTGKTRVYIEAAKIQLRSGKDVLILTPEISLTPQLARELERAFQDRVIVLHSNLSGTARRQAWLAVLTATSPVVVIGPRSALFAPFRRLGLVVVDEAHEGAYKQEQAPYYDGRRVASQLAALHGALAILGSATPNVADYYVATVKNAPVIRLTELATSHRHAKPEIRVVLTRDKTQFTRHPQLSDALLEGIETSLNAKEQSLVFLNRRGTARLVLCQTCGWQATCPNCDLPLTYHGDKHLMRCHTCGHREAAVSSCPTCQGVEILFRSIGTKSIQEALAHLFPKARIRRFDTDNLKEDRFEEHFEAVSRGEVDILIGTQLLTKGLDLTKLSFVGVVSADTALSFPDFTATEKTFQLLTQVLGRIGRGHLAGRAVIQTFQPNSPAVLAAINKDWESFYNAEISERQLFLFPPFCFVLKISCSRKTVNGAEKAAVAIKNLIRQLTVAVQIIGPSPSFYEKSAGNYHWQLVIKSKQRDYLLRIIAALPAGCNYDIDPIDLL